jgi:hypothetical protein
MTTSAPKRRMISTFAGLAISGTKMRAGMPSCLAA